jgi:hypothetical protein
VANFTRGGVLTHLASAVAKMVTSEHVSKSIGRPVMRTNVGKILILFFLASFTHGQYLRETRTTDTGLPQNSVTGLAQTPDSYLRLTTNDGLVRFDGLPGLSHGMCQTHKDIINKDLLEFIQQAKQITATA